MFVPFAPLPLGVLSVVKSAPTKQPILSLSQDILGCVCVNPGRLTKGQVGGTFGRLYLRRPAGDGEERQSPCVAAQVVRI